MKRINILLSILCLILVTGCGANQVQPEENTSVEGNNETVVIDTPTTEETQESNATLDDFISLLGKTDEEAKTAFGGGEENRTESGYLLGRIYSVKLFDEETSLYTSYRDDDILNSMNAELKAKKVEEYHELLNTFIGEPIEINDTPSEGGSTNSVWKINDYLITVYQDYNGTITINFLLPDDPSKNVVATRTLSEHVVDVMAETEKYPALEQLIIDTYDIPEDFYARTKYYYNYIDLNRDGKDEIFVIIMGPYTSGSGGSSAMIVYPVDDQLYINQKFTLMRTPVIIAENYDNGADDIIIYKSGGGIEGSYVRMVCNDGEYTTVNDAEPIDSLDGVYGYAIISNNLTQDMDNGTFLTLEK